MGNIFMAVSHLANHGGGVEVLSVMHVFSDSRPKLPDVGLELIHDDGGCRRAFGALRATKGVQTRSNDGNQSLELVACLANAASLLIVDGNQEAIQGEEQRRKDSSEHETCE